MPIEIDSEKCRDARAYTERVFWVVVALDEFYEPHDAVAWLGVPQPLLNGRRPCDLLRTPDGTKEVQAVIAQLRDATYV